MASAATRALLPGSIPAAVAGSDEAAKQAAATQTSVEVTSATTPTTQLFANPDGSMTLNDSATPVRVQKNGTWVSIDTTLAANADGTFSPKAAVSSLTLSHGGAGPFIRFNRGGAAIAVSWPTPLPAPVVSADTATYQEILPGVDLRVTAQQDGVSEVLVVKSATAAALSAVKHPSFGLSVTGGTVKTNPAGGFSVLNTAGESVMTSGQPLMWDSAGATISSSQPAGTKLAPSAGDGSPLVNSVDGTTPAEQYDSPSAGDQAAVMSEAVTSASLALTPDPTLLSGKATVYPVLIDPAVTGPKQNAHAMVDKSFPKTKYYNWTDADQGVGYQNYSGTDTKRLLFRFPVSTVAGTNIISATFSDTETYAATCTAEPVELWRTGAFSSSTTWNAQPSWSSKMDTRSVSNGRSGCSSPNATLVKFTATAGVTTFAASKAEYAYFGLKASSESSASQWKRFKAAATLTINYNHIPTLPTSLKGPGGCAPTATAPAYVNSTSVVMSASMTDADSGDQLRGHFSILNSANTVLTEPLVGYHSQGKFTTPAYVVPTPPAGTTALYHWKVYSDDKTNNSSTAGLCYFVVDLTKPSGPSVSLTWNGTTTTQSPAVSTPPGPVAVPVGTPLTFTFAPSGTVSDTVRYRWSINSDTPNSEWLPSSTSTTPAPTVTKALTLASSGPNLLRVWAYDKANNSSAVTEFPLNAAGFLPTRWAMDSSSSPSAADQVCVPSGIGPAPTSLTWFGTAASSAGHVATVSTDRALHLDGTGMAASTGPAPVAVDTSGASSTQGVNYTASAWVKVSPAALNESVDGAALLVGGGRTAFSVDGASGSALTVGLSADPGTISGTISAARFTATLTGAGAGPVVMDLADDVTSTNWYQISVTVDEADELLELDVVADDGTGLTPPVVTTAGWTPTFVAAPATGSLRLGSSKPTTGTTPVMAWAGDLDEVLNLRGAFPSPDGSRVSPELHSWLTLIPPFTTPSKTSPCG